MEEAGIRYIVGVVKGVVGSGFNIKGRGGMGTGLPKSNLKVEDIEAAAQFSSRHLDWFPIKHTNI